MRVNTTKALAQYTIILAFIFALAFSGQITYAQVSDQISVSQLYENIQDSVVVIRALEQQSGTLGGQTYNPIQGSGFVYNTNGCMVILTNYHVVAQSINISVTFRNGNGYSGFVMGADPYVDLAVVGTYAPESEYKPMAIASSSSLKVGDFVAALGTPFGLSGSITTGIVSQLGRTVTEEEISNYAIANVIQIDAPINPGNSGGPLVNSKGEVVGINTAGVTGSQGVGFAIPSDTITRELSTLIQTGTYTQHSYLGITGTDMNFDIANQSGVNVTYGVLIQSVTSGGPADRAGIRPGTTQRTINGANIAVGGDLVIALNGTKIIDTDQLSSYLEQRTLPNENLIATVLRNGQSVTITVLLGTRPAPSGFVAPTPVPSHTPIPEISSLAAMALMITIALLTVLLVAKR